MSFCEFGKIESLFLRTESGSTINSDFPIFFALTANKPLTMKAISPLPKSKRPVGLTSALTCVIAFDKSTTDKR